MIKLENLILKIFRPRASDEKTMPKIKLKLTTRNSLEWISKLNGCNDKVISWVLLMQKIVMILAIIIKNIRRKVL